MPACTHPDQAPCREQHDAPHAPSGCDSRTGRDRELGIDIFAPASLALVQRCDIANGWKVHSGKCAVLAGGNRPERLKSRTVKKIAPQPGECSEKCAECNGRGARGVPDFEKYCRGSTRPASGEV